MLRNRRQNKWIERCRGKQHTDCGVFLSQWWGLTVVRPLASRFITPRTHATVRWPPGVPKANPCFRSPRGHRWFKALSINATYIRTPDPTRLCCHKAYTYKPRKTCSRPHGPSTKFFALQATPVLCKSPAFHHFYFVRWHFQGPTSVTRVEKLICFGEWLR